MTVHAGRKQPCPCGSGKEYNKCCLPKDEAEDRGTILTPTDNLPEDDEWELDVETITRVCCTDGMFQTVAAFVGTWGDSQAGEPIQVDVVDVATGGERLRSAIARSAS